MRDRLSIVLRVRRIQEGLARAKAVQADADAHAATAEREQRARGHSRRDATGSGLTSFQLRSLQLQGMASYAHLLAAAHAEEQARERRDVAVSDHGAAAVRRKGAERMVDRRHERAAAIVAGNAQRALDELSVARWRRR